jgi:hypothetical protein
MRRILLGAFLFLAACGGGLKGESPQVADPGADARAERAQLVMSAAGQQALADIARTADPAALEACINAYVDDFGGASSPNEGPISKPSVAQMQGFLVQCLADHVPGVPDGLRAASPQALRSDGAEGLRTSWDGEVRTSSAF